MGGETGIVVRRELKVACSARHLLLIQAPRGRDEIARGKASRRPGLADRSFAALKGRDGADTTGRPEPPAPS